MVNEHKTILEEKLDDDEDKKNNNEIDINEELSTIENGTIQKRLVEKIDQQYKKEERKYIIKKHQSMGKFLKAH